MNDQTISAYLNVFLDELDEQLQTLDKTLLELENGSDHQTTLQSIFRAAHTMKGSSAAMGFENMKNLTHQVETIFDYLRMGKMRINASLMNSLFQFVDYLRRQRENFLNGIFEEESIAQLMGELELYMSAEAVAFTEAIESSLSDAAEAEVVKLAFLEPYLHAILQKLEQGEVIIKLEVQLKQATEMPYVRAFLVYEYLKERGEVLATFPVMTTIQEDELFLGQLSYVITAGEDFLNVISELREMSQVESVLLETITKQSLDFLQNLPLPQDKQIVLPQGNSDHKFQATQTVRVDVNRLENLLNLVGELIIDHTRLKEVNKIINDKYKGTSEATLLGDISSHFSSVISELQEGMMKTRMLPIEQLFNRFPRMARDLAQQVNKEIELIIEGKETELDRTLIEEISDPLIHILRNSLDHGLELPEERLRLGKPRKGQLLIRASHEENAIVIRVTDDGRGIDADKIKQKAIEKGFVSQDEADRMTDKEKVALIFHSGMSTAEQVTELSGRGVGMDIVRCQVEKLNGVIDIETRIGIGTTIAVKIPLTLAIIRSLLVSLGKQTIALPLINIIEISRLHEQDIKWIHGKEVCMFRGEILPFVRMDKLLHVAIEESNETNKRLFVVTVGVAEKRVCLLFDRPIANQEIVVKSLGSYVGHVPYIAGSTLMGDGSIALILDVASIVREVGTSNHAVGEGNKDKLHVRKETKMVTFILDEVRYGMDICKAKEIMPVPEITRIAQAEQNVTGLFNLRGKLLPLYDLRQGLGIEPRGASNKSRVIIADVMGRDIGVLVDEVTGVMTLPNEDIDEIPDGLHIQNKAVIGIYKQEKQLIFVLNMDNVWV